jgi:Ser/Thr protein kinase RdoA (MazF antagonist)
MPVRAKPSTPDYFSLGERLLAVLTENYGLRGADAFLPILLDGDTATLLEVRSTTSRKALVDDDLGTWFVKQVPWYADDERRLRFAGEVTGWLSRHTDLVPAVRPALDGQGWLRLPTGEAYVLAEYRPGLRYRRRPAQVRAAGVALAGLHECPVPDGGPGEDYRDLVADHLDLARRLAGPGAGGVLDLMAEWVARMRELLPDPLWARLPAGLVHGDYNPCNVLFTGDDTVAGVVDFDNCDTGTRLRDLVEGVVTFTALSYVDDTTSFARPFRCEPDPGAAARFVDGYLATAPALGDDERAALPGLVTGVHCELVSLGVLRGEVGDADLDTLRALEQTFAGTAAAIGGGAA